MKLSVENQLGPLFKVEPASDLIPLGKGWIVSLREKDLAVWTGGIMTLNEAADLLLSHAFRRS